MSKNFYLIGRKNIFKEKGYQDFLKKYSLKDNIKHSVMFEELVESEEERRHIGHISAGWLPMLDFSMYGKGNEQLHLDLLLKEINNKENIIIDEYGDELSVEDFKKYFFGHGNSFNKKYSLDNQERQALMTLKVDNKEIDLRISYVSFS